MNTRAHFYIRINFSLFMKYHFNMAHSVVEFSHYGCSIFTLKLSQRLNDEVIQKCGPKFLIKWLGLNGPNQCENLHYNSKISGIGLLTSFLTNFDIKHCISLDFSFWTWFFSKSSSFVLICFEIKKISWPLSNGIQNKPRKKSSKLSVQTFKRSHISKNDPTLEFKSA